MPKTAEEDDDDGEEILWWGKPLKARRYHVFQGEGLAESLCGNWMLTHEPVDEAVTPESDKFRDGKDCKACCREADLMPDDE